MFTFVFTSTLAEGRSKRPRTDKMCELMSYRVTVGVALTFLLGCSPPAPRELELHDAIEKAASDLRWNRQTEAVAVARIYLPMPVAVLALSPGKYSTEQLQALLPSAEGKDQLNGRLAASPSPSIYLFGPGRAEQGSYFQEHVLVPKSIGLWKQDDTPLQVILRRDGDDVHIVGLR